MSGTYYKVLAEDGQPYHGGTGQWALPTEGGPGAWMPRLAGRLRPCEHGYRLCRPQDLVMWLGPVLYVAEARGRVVVSDTKVVAHEARLLRRVAAWNAQTARLFAADCAEHVLPLWTAYAPDDDRPARAIEAARDYVRGSIDSVALAAAGDAAWAAARDAAGAAAWAAAGAAAWAAAGTAAWDAARAAAWAAARDAERTWQTARLFALLGEDA